MKKLIILLLLLSYSVAIFSQLNQILYKEFCEFVEAQQSGQPIEPKVDPLVYLQLDEPYKSFKKKVKKQVLDSIVSYDGLIKKVASFTYDESGNQLSIKQKNQYADINKEITTILFEYKNSKLINIKFERDDSRIYYQFKADYFYKKDKLITSRLFRLDEQKKEWNITKNTEFAYNTNNQIESVISVLIDSGRKPLHSSFIYTYDKNKIIVDEIFVPFRGSDHVPRQSIYTFNQCNNLIEIEKTEIENSQINRKKEIFIFNESGEISSINLFRFNSSKEEWTTTSEQTYFYNDKDKIATYNKIRHYDNPNTKNISKTIYTYDKNGFLSTETIQIFNDSIAKFEDIRKQVYSFDIRGNYKMSEYFSWDSSINDWEKISGMTNVFNMNFNFAEDILFPEYSTVHGNLTDDYVFKQIYKFYQFTYSESYGSYDPFDYSNWNMQTKHTTFNYNNRNEAFEERLSIDYFYSELNVNLNNKTQPDIIVYPNPAYNYFTIDLPTLPINSKIKMYNLSGFKVMEQPVFSEELIYINHLQSGLYYFQLYVDGDKVERTGKLMIR